MAKSNFKPSAVQRSLVKSLAMIGIPCSHIATVIGRSRGVLKRYFAKELRQGYGQAVVRVATVAHEMAKSGKYPSVSKFWTETVGHSLLNIVADEKVEGSFALRFRSEGTSHRRRAVQDRPTRLLRDWGFKGPVAAIEIAVSSRRLEQ